MYVFDPTYQTQTEEALQLKLQTPPHVGLIKKDTIHSVGITRTQFNILEIDHNLPERFKQLIPKKTESPPALSVQDSLKLNLKGNNQAFTNWHMSLMPGTQEFNDTAFSHFNPEILNAARLKKDNEFALTDSLSHLLVSESDSLRVSQHITHIEKGESVPEPQLMIKPPLRADWFLAVLTISLLIAGFVRLNWGRYLNNMLQSIVFPNAMGKLEGSNVSNFYPSFVLGCLFYLNTSIFIFQILTLSDRSFLGFNSILIIPVVFAFLLILFSLKILAYKIVGHIFETKNLIRDYLFGASTMSKAYGILLLPIIVFIPFVDENIQSLLVKTGLGIFILLYLMQIARGVRIILSNTFSVYYIILYLCGLEILPLTILFKVMFR